MPVCALNGCMRPVSQNLQFHNLAKRRAIRGAILSYPVETMLGMQYVRNAAAWLAAGANRKLMQTNFERFSVGNFNLYPFAYMLLIETARVHSHWQSCPSNAQHTEPYKKTNQTADKMPALQNTYSTGATPSSERTSTKWPAMAAAADMTGLTRCVRLSLPWRPSKLRLLVLALRSCGGRTSACIPMHLLHPESRHSNPPALTSS